MSGREELSASGHRKVPLAAAREVSLWANLQHPNVQHVLLHERDGQSIRLATEDAHGRALTALVADTRLPLVRASHVIEQVLSALAVAHAAGLVHGALSPDRVAVGQHLGDPDFVKVLDFVGVAATPGYIAPEVARGAKADERSDLFAVGCMAYLAMTGLSPLDAEGAIPKPARDAAPDARIPFGLSEFVARLMAVDPTERFQTADAARNALRRIYASRSMIRYGARPITERARLSLEPVAPQPKPSTRWYWIAAVAIVAIGIAIGVWQWLG